MTDVEIKAPSDRLLKFFKADHLPEPLRLVSVECRALAESMAAELPEGPEKTAGLRKLLEAKDCFVRAKLEQTRERDDGR